MAVYSCVQTKRTIHMCAICCAGSHHRHTDDSHSTTGGPNMHRWRPRRQPLTSSIITRPSKEVPIKVPLPLLPTGAIFKCSLTFFKCSLSL